MPKLYFITHPEVVIDPDVPIIHWRLSRQGKERVKRLSTQEWVSDIEVIHSSDETKAFETAEIIADSLQLEVFTASKLGEVDRSSTGYLPLKEYEKAAKEWLETPEKNLLGWEKATSAQKRIVKQATTLIDIKPLKNVAIFSHGGVGTLLLCHFLHVSIHPRYDQPNLGSYFIVDIETKRVEKEWREY